MFLRSFDYDRQRGCYGLLVGFILVLAPSRAGAQPLLYVANESNNTIGVYNALTGATINAALVNGQGLNEPVGLVIDSNNRLFVANSNNDTIGQYDAVTGATINATFINNSQGSVVPEGLALDGKNHLFPVGRAVGEYNATTGATINAAFISGSQLGIPVCNALDGHNHMFVTNGPGGKVGEYDATTGATINASFVSGLNDPDGIVVDALGHLLITEPLNNSVTECDAVTGAILNVNFFVGLNHPTLLVFDNNNHLFISNAANNTIGEYDATTGATINAAFINGQGLSFPDGLVFVSAPEPGSLALVSVIAAGALGGAPFRRRRPKM